MSEFDLARLPLAGRPHLAAAVAKPGRIHARELQWVIPRGDCDEIRRNFVQRMGFEALDCEGALERLAEYLELAIEHGTAYRSGGVQMMGGVHHLLGEPFVPSRHDLALFVLGGLRVSNERRRWIASIDCTLRAVARDRGQ